MKRTISILALSAPLAIVALSLGASPALAEVAPSPGDIAANTVVIDPVGPQIPGDKLAPADPGDPDPDPDPDPGPGPGDGPGDLTGPKPCPTHGSCGHDPSDEDEKDPGDDSSTGDEIDKPTRIDAGAVSASSDEGTGLPWLLAGGFLVTATGAAYAVRRRERTS